MPNELGFDYELLDFGQGRKLERFGDRVLDRPCPAAESAQRGQPRLWTQAVAKYERQSVQTGEWTNPRDRRGGECLPAAWTVALGCFQLELRPTPAGHLGVFMEQSENWHWIAKQIARAGRPLRVLNLFAYTGASTLAAAAAGAEVTHVDSASNIVQWARHNARLNGLDAAPIRWITEDAAKFVQRELKRGQTYDAVILDPPSYGHGPKGEVFKLTEALLPLLQDCGELTASRRAFMLLTCHSPGYGPAELEACLSDAVFGACSAGASAKSLFLTTAEGRKLHAGSCARWPGTVA